MISGKCPVIAYQPASVIWEDVLIDDYYYDQIAIYFDGSFVGIPFLVRVCSFIVFALTL